MKESDIEDLIASYPAEFFRRHKLTLQGRQKAFSGVGRFDLLFTDEFGTNILMELKAVPARYEDATQLAKYKDELQRRGEGRILMWLVAPQVSTSVREFLDQIGIEYSEIHEAEFRRVATQYSVKLRTDAPSDKLEQGIRVASIPAPRPRISEPHTRVQIGPAVTSPSKFRWQMYSYDLALLNPEEFEKQTFEKLIDSFEQAVPSRKNAALVTELRTWATDAMHSRWKHSSNCSLLRWVTTSGWRDVVPHAEALWAYLFGRPVPGWYVWRKATQRYDFDSKAWAVWCESLSRSMKSVEAIYKQHNAPDARNWPVEKQCQCKDCEAYRSAHPSTSSL